MSVENFLNYSVTDKEKEHFIKKLTDELIMLRTKAGISQDELSSMIGVSRQTYGSIERKTRTMSWSTYLALIMFYDYNQRTHRILRSTGAFPHDIIKKFNNGEDEVDISAGSFLGDGSQSIISKLDDQALHAIRTMIMLEYARCTETPGEVVIKAFDGINFTKTPQITENNRKATQAIRSIRGRRRSR